MSACRVNRRAFIAGGVAGGAWLGSASSSAAQAPIETALMQTLREFDQYIAATVSVLSQFAISIRLSEVRTIVAASHRAGLERMAGAIERLYMRQSVLVGDLEAYARAVREHGQSDVAEEQWREILSKVSITANVVREVMAIAEETPSLNITIGPEQTELLTQTLNSRAGLLSRFEEMPAPQEDGELALLEAMSVRYRRLIETLLDVHAAILTALGASE